jgi:hypothetical protein
MLRFINDIHTPDWSAFEKLTNPKFPQKPLSILLNRCLKIGMHPLL